MRDPDINLYLIFDLLNRATDALIKLGISFQRLPSPESHNGDIAYAPYASQHTIYPVGEVDISPTVSSGGSCSGIVIAGHNAVTFLGGWIFNPFTQQMNLKNYFEHLKSLIEPVHEKYPHIKFPTFLDNYVANCPEKMETVLLIAKSVFGDLLLTNNTPDAPIRFTMTKFSDVEKHIANETGVDIYFNPIKQTLADQYRTPTDIPSRDTCVTLNKLAEKGGFRFTVEDMTLPIPADYTTQQLQYLFGQCGVNAAKLDFSPNPYNLDQNTLPAMVAAYNRLYLEYCLDNFTNVNCQSLSNATSNLENILRTSNLPQSRHPNLLSIIVGPIGNKELHEQYCKMRQEPPLLLTFQHVLLWTLLELLFSRIQYVTRDYADMRCIKKDKKDYIYYSAKTGEYVIWMMFRGIINFAFIMGIFGQAYSSLGLAFVILSYLTSAIFCQEQVRTSHYFQHPADKISLQIAMTLFSIVSALFSQFASCDVIAGILRVLIGSAASASVFTAIEFPKLIYYKISEHRNKTMNERSPRRNVYVPILSRLSWGQFFKCWGFAVRDAMCFHTNTIANTVRSPFKRN